MCRPNNCEECNYFHICRAYYGGRGCEYSEEGKDENIEIYRHRTEQQERPGM